MQNIIEYKSWIVGGVFILLFGLEHIFPYVEVRYHSFRRIIKNLWFWPINIGLSLSVIFPVSYFSAQNALWVRSEWFSGFYGFIFDIVLLDLFIFCWHRFVHETPFFWRFHEVHHLDQHLDTTSAIRFHFGEIFFSTLIRAFVIVLFAVPFSSVIVFETLVLIFTLFHHSNIALPPHVDRFLSKVFVTPSLHWVHHHAIRKDTDSNYGTIFSVWDKLFHTKSPARRFRGMKIGVERKSDKSFFKLLTLPFLQDSDR